MLNRGLLVAGNVDNGTNAGSWCRYGGYSWSNVDYDASFRAAAYAQ